MKVYGNLERASFESLSSDPAQGITARCWWNTTTLQVKTDDGTNIRALLRNDAKAVIGNSGTAANNIRFHRGAAGVLQLVVGNDATAEGTLSTALNQLSARIENYATASLPAAANAGRLFWDTDLSLPKVDTGAAIKQILLADGTQVVTNKDINGGTAADTRRITLPGDTKTNLDGLTRKAGTILYGTDTQKAYLDQGSFLKEIGSGSGGGINYITNPDAEVDTAGWSTYADAAGNVPVNGTGGTATGLTFARSTGSPLVGLGSFLLTQANSTSLQGKGVSCPFTIDSAYEASVLAINFNFNASSTFVAGNGTPPLNDGTTSTNAGNSDIEVFVYDVTNSALIYVTPQVITAKGTNNFQFTGQFQTNANSTSYRLILHVATASANATGWTFKFDNVSVGPQAISYGPAMSDVTPYTMVITGASGDPTPGVDAVVSSTWKQIGDEMEIDFTYRQVTAGSAGSGATLFHLPTGYTIDSTKLNVNNAGFFAIKGSGGAGGGANAYRSYTPFADSTDFTAIQLIDTAGGTAQYGSGGYNFSSANMGVSFTCRVPILGWSSRSQVSSDADTRIVASRASGTAPSTTAGNVIIFDTEDFDTHAAYDLATGRFTAPVSGVYEISGAVVASGTYAAQLYKNGVLDTDVGYADTGAGGSTALSGLIKLVAGDIIDIRPTGTTGSIGAGQICFSRKSGPASIAMSESVSASYYLSANAAFSSAQINFDTKEFDSHNAVTTGASWKFTAPIAGKYHVDVTSVYSSGAATDIRIWKNGTAKKVLIYNMGSTQGYSGHTLIDLAAGDYIDFRTDVNVTLTGAAAPDQQTFVSIFRTGN